MATVPPLDLLGVSSQSAPPSEKLETNESLREEIQRLSCENRELSSRLAVAERARDLDRKSRLAALNLMEDAVAARHAEQVEIEERRRVEEELREAHRRKDEFLATLAHELRNPLAPIRNSLNILRLGPRDEAVTGQIYGTLERQEGHMVRLVDDLLEISRITRGRIEYRKQHLDLASVVYAAVEASHPLIDIAHHKLTISLPEEKLLLFADPIRLTQVVSNLLNNAAKYTKEYGQIGITACRQGNSVLLSIHDNGEGIPADMLDKIFDPFTQVDRSHRSAQGGLGIGLTLVRTLVEAHGGSVHARSPGAGKGSEFVIRLPLVTRSQDVISQEPQQQYSRLPFRILVVDDNRDAAETTSSLLKLLDAEVMTAYHGETALGLVRSFRPAIMLLDIGMPGMDGNEVARRVRNMEQGRHITIIALTGWGQEDDRKRCKAAGFDHHLVKPVELNTLYSLLYAIPTSVRT